MEPIEVKPVEIIHAQPIVPIQLKEIVVNFDDEEDPYLVILAARNEKDRSNCTRKTIEDTETDRLSNQDRNRIMSLMKANDRAKSELEDEQALKAEIIRLKNI